MTRKPFADLPKSAATHFRLQFYAALGRVLGGAAERLGSAEALCAQFPFVDGYLRELMLGSGGRLPPAQVSRWWRGTIAAWEGESDAFLPIRAIREAAGLDHDELAIVFGVGLLEEDSRFGALFEALHAVDPHRRPSVGLIATCFCSDGDAGEVRSAIGRLHALGLLHIVNPDAPRVQWALEVPHPVWDVLRGDVSDNPVPWARHRSTSVLQPFDDLILPLDLRNRLSRVGDLLHSGDVETIVLRGPGHNGRRTVLGAIARNLGLGVLEVDDLVRPDDRRWQQLSVLATGLRALPVVAANPAPGETFDVPRRLGCEQRLGIVMGRQGGVTGHGAGRALTFTLDMPNAAERREHWTQGLGSHSSGDLGAISERFRLTGGNIRRAAGLAHSYASLDGRELIALRDVLEAERALNRQALDTLAVRMPASGDWSDLAVRDETLRDLQDLETRCRQREALAATARSSARSSCGVRALFRGPSGTGKTLAARLLASTLQMDLYRLDLSTIVNKYIGETEKNLERVLSRAEELDVVLLLDEGDALLTQRTSVQTSNDRYANLETNYLLQRLEGFDGILVVTTNAGDRIDPAFERRMDVVVEFHPPDAAERLDILRMHLPRAHAIDSEFMTEVARRCVLSGGQIRNAAIHASLLAMDRGGTVATDSLDAAIRREYRKAGAVCPLRRPTFSMADA